MISRIEKHGSKKNKQSTSIRQHKMKRLERNKLKKEKRSNKIRNMLLILSIIIIGVLIYYITNR